MPNARAFDPAEYRDNPKMIAKYLNNALASGDVALITKAIGDMVWAQGPSKIFAEGRLKPRRPLSIIRRTDGSRVRYGDKSSARARHTLVTKPIDRPADPGPKAKGK
jgi:hypothetical protein